MKSNILKTLFTILIPAMLFVACEDDPSSLGLDNIPDTDKLGISTINSLEVPMTQHSSYYNASLVDTNWNLGTSIRLHLGQYSDISSSMLVRFRSNVADSISDYYDNGELSVLESWIELRPVSTLGPESSQPNILVSKINSSWTSTFFTEDSLEQNILPYISDTKTINEVSDSLIKFEISNDMAMDWLVGSMKDSLELNNGLLFEPASNSDKIFSFYSLHEDNIAEGYENIPVAKIVVQRASLSPDTLNFYTSRDVHVVRGSYPVNDQNYIYLQGGFPLRANYFIDVSLIPDNSVIVDAKFEFSFNPDLSYFSSASSGTINMIMYEDSTEKDLLVGTTRKNLTIGDSLSNKYVGDITSYVQRWNQGTDNQGVFVYIPDEQYTLNRIAIYSPKASDPLLRPKLTIRYTKR